MSEARHLILSLLLNAVKTLINGVNVGSLTITEGKPGRSSDSGPEAPGGAGDRIAEGGGGHVQRRPAEVHCRC